MAKIYGFSIKKLNTFMGREGEGSQGDIYYNGKKVGWYSNNADGGMADIKFDGSWEQRRDMERLLKEATVKYYARFPLTGEFAVLEPDEELFMENLVGFTLDEKEFKKYQKEGYIGMAVFQKRGEPYREYMQLFRRTEAMDLFQRRTDIENAKLYTRDAFVIEDELPQISQGEKEENTQKMGM